MKPPLSGKAFITFEAPAPPAAVGDVLTLRSHAGRCGLFEEWVVEAEVGRSGATYRFLARELRSGGRADLLCWGGDAGAIPDGLDRLLRHNIRHLSRCFGLCVLPSGCDGVLLERPAGRPLRTDADPGAPPPPLRDILAILSPVAEALDALHGLDLLHLELRPEHIMRTDDARGVVLCGLGRGVQPLRAPSHVTADLSDSRSSQAALLPICAYLAPEQILSDRSGPIDRRTDIYSFAAIAFHLLTGHPPFGRDGAMATLGAHLTSWRPLCTTYRPDLGEALDSVLLRALALDIEERPPSCQEFMDDLRAALSSRKTPERQLGCDGGCVLVIAGNAAARRELQGMVAAVAPQIPVLTDDGPHGLTLALRYLPTLVLLHISSLSDDLAIRLCQRLRGEPALGHTQIVALLGQNRGDQASQLGRMGVMVASSMYTPSGSHPQALAGPPGESRPLLQLLRRCLSSSRSTRK